MSGWRDLARAEQRNGARYNRSVSAASWRKERCTAAFVLRERKQRRHMAVESVVSWSSKRAVHVRIATEIGRDSRFWIRFIRSRTRSVLAQCKKIVERYLNSSHGTSKGAGPRLYSGYANWQRSFIRWWREDSSFEKRILTRVVIAEHSHMPVT